MISMTLTNPQRGNESTYKHSQNFTYQPNVSDHHIFVPEPQWWHQNLFQQRQMTYVEPCNSSQEVQRTRLSTATATSKLRGPEILVCDHWELHGDSRSTLGRLQNRLVHPAKSSWGGFLDQQRPLLSKTQTLLMVQQHFSSFLGCWADHIRALTN